MDDALRWYVRRTEQTEEEEVIVKKMKKIKEDHSQIQIAALIAVYTRYKTTDPKDLNSKTGGPLTMVAEVLGVPY